MLVLLSLVLPLYSEGALAQEEAIVITPGYEDRPDDDPYTYFPTRPFLYDGMRRIARDLHRSVDVDDQVRDVLLLLISNHFTQFGAYNFESATHRQLYRAAIEVRDCRLAEELLWQSLISDRPFMRDMRHDRYVEEYLRLNLLEEHLPELAACLYAQDARSFARMIELHSEQTTGTDDLVRPFVDHRSFTSGALTLHMRRDRSFWRLFEMAASKARNPYPLAGVLLVEMALELNSIAMPNDILHMLLLNAQANWPEAHGEAPLPVTLARVEELLPITAARLSPELLAQAERCFMTDDLYFRSFFSDRRFFSGESEKSCFTQQP